MGLFIGCSSTSMGIKKRMSKMRCLGTIRQLPSLRLHVSQLDLREAKARQRIAFTTPYHIIQTRRNHECKLLRSVDIILLLTCAVRSPQPAANAAISVSLSETPTHARAQRLIVSSTASTRMSGSVSSGEPLNTLVFWFPWTRT